MIVVTGGAGFIGRALCLGLNARGREDLLVVDSADTPAKAKNLDGLRLLDLWDKHRFREAVRRGRAPRTIEAILHQGACTDTLVTDEAYFADNNLRCSIELLDLALERRIPFLYASSAAVYGPGPCFVEDPRCEAPLNLYGLYKKRFDDHVRALLPSASATVAGLRYFNVYGPGEAHKGHMASMPYQLCQELLKTGKATLFQGIKDLGPGDQCRDFVHIDDVTAVNLHVLDGPPVHGLFNVGSGRSRTYNEVAAALIARLGHGAIRYQDIPEAMRPRYQGFTQADLAALRKAGCGLAFRSLEEGLDRSLAAWSRVDDSPRDD